MSIALKPATCEDCRFCVSRLAAEVTSPIWDKWVDVCLLNMFPPTGKLNPCPAGIKKDTARRKKKDDCLTRLVKGLESCLEDPDKLVKVKEGISCLQHLDRR